MDLAPSYFGINTMFAELSQWKFSKCRLEKRDIIFMRSSLITFQHDLENKPVTHPDLEHYWRASL
jgi:hypothetical protein